jgi:catechol 2,3-dioxygenase-like lactoylglutathione lyase family enzyme
MQEIVENAGISALDESSDELFSCSSHRKTARLRSFYVRKRRRRPQPWMSPARCTAMRGSGGVASRGGSGYHAHNLKGIVTTMIKFDHMTVPVTDARRSRDFYVGTLGFKVEFEDAARKIVAIQDDAGFTIFLCDAEVPRAGAKCSFTMQVKDVDATHEELARRGVKFEKAPQKNFWGYGAELRDPDGYLVMLWDEVTMREKSR